ncbi:UNVERIFIED_CONTAM: hypothetical protein RF653_12160 [Kocuria sp. CPCC 205316]|uniref:hypothetical protein n=1 Tax=Kocuria TaxID=57493 RepID=UPI0036DF9948
MTSFFRPLRQRRLSRNIAIVVGAVLLVTLDQNSTGTVGPKLTFGVLDSTCAADRVGALSRAGVELAQMDVLWDQLEPIPGQVDREYADDLAAAITTCQDAGIKVILGLGLQYAPEWVRDLPNGTYWNQAGDPHTGQVPNIVFSKYVRQAFEQHAANVLRIAPPASIHAIRLGTSEGGELGYPLGKKRAEHSVPNFWAFNEANPAVNNVPPDVGQAPLPGWRPGDGTWRGQAVTPAQMRSWFGWYSEAPVAAVLWQANVLRGLGFSGNFHVPLAGGGAYPSQLQKAIASELVNIEDPDGSLERGLYYPDQLRALSKGEHKDALIADVTGLDDVTAVQARSRTPATDSCSPVDHLIDLTTNPDAERWSSSRWTIANARKFGLKVIGENPGSPHASNTGGHSESDDLQDQMKHAPRYAAECGLSMFLWAFEDNLFSEPQHPRLDDYRKSISTYQ